MWYVSGTYKSDQELSLDGFWYFEDFLFRDQKPKRADKLLLLIIIMITEKSLSVVFISKTWLASKIVNY